MSEIFSTTPKEASTNNLESDVVLPESETLDQTIEALLQRLAAAENDNTKLREENMELRRQTEEDALTGLLNERGFLRKAGEITRESPPKQLFLMGVGDANNFKPINDLYGHGVGDDALKIYSDVLSSFVRRSDIAGRMHGDEYQLLMAVDADKAADEEAIHVRFRQVLEERARKIIETIQNKISNISQDTTVAAHYANIAQLSERDLNQLGTMIDMSMAFVIRSGEDLYNPELSAEENDEKIRKAYKDADLELTRIKNERSPIGRRAIAYTFETRDLAE